MNHLEQVKFAQMVRKMRPPIFFTFLGVFWGVIIIGEGFCAFCDLVRTFFGACGTFLGTLFWGFGVVEKHFDQNNDVYAF